MRTLLLQTPERGAANVDDDTGERGTVESFDISKSPSRQELCNGTGHSKLARTLEKEWVKPRDEAGHAAQPEEVMIIAFPFALLGAAFLVFVHLAARE